MTEKLSINLRILVSALSILSGIALLVYPPALFSPEANKAAALSIVVLSLWATGIIAEYLTSLLFFLLAMLLTISGPDVVFSGFRSTAFWLVFSGLILGFAIMDTGLGNRIAHYIVTLMKGGYSRLIGVAVIMGVLFSFLIPSALGRAVLLAPIGLAIARHFGFPNGSNGQTGIVLALIVGTVLPACAILPANVVNMVMAGMAETHLKIPLLFGEYLLLQFPVLGFLKAAMIVGLILWIYPDTPRKSETRSLPARGPLSTRELIVLLITISLLILWASDFLHHISPAWVALGGALFLLLPKMGIVGIQQFNKDISYGSLFFLAGILGFGGIISQTGLGDVIADKLIASSPLAEDKPFLNYLVLSLISMFIGNVTTVAGVPAVITPLCDNLSQVTGLPLKTVLMTQVPGFSTIILPFQAPAILVGVQLSGIKISSASFFCLILAVFTILFLWPANYFWWRALGWI